MPKYAPKKGYKGRQAAYKKKPYALPYTPTYSAQPLVASNQAKSSPGFPLGSKSAKSRNFEHVQNDMLPYQAYAFPIDEIGKGSSIDQRERDLVTLRGWKAKCFFLNRHIVPVTMRYAIVAARQTLGTTPAAHNTRLLRAHTNVRSTDMGVNNDGLMNCTNALNSDAYMILHQSKFDIGIPNGASAYAYGQRGNEHYMEKWVPLNKQLRYDVTGESETPVHVIFWYDTKQRFSGQLFSALSGGGLDFRINNIAYFHDKD